MYGCVVSGVSELWNGWMQEGMRVFIISFGMTVNGMNEKNCEVDEWVKDGTLRWLRSVDDSKSGSQSEEWVNG